MPSEKIRLPRIDDECVASARLRAPFADLLYWSPYHLVVEVKHPPWTLLRRMPAPGSSRRLAASGYYDGLK
jgi:hypothetical protein